jgi:hypothetical protein
VAAGDEAAEVEHGVEVAAARGGAQAGEVGGQLAIRGHEGTDLVLAHRREPAPLRVGEGGGEGGPPRRALRDDRVLLAAGAGVAAGGDPARPRLPLALEERGERLLAVARELWRAVAEASGQARGELGAPRGVERGPPGDEALEERELVVGEQGADGWPRRAGRVGACVEGSAHAGRGVEQPFANDERAGGDVAHPPPLCGEGRARDADAVQQSRLHVDDADDVAHRRGPEGHGVAAILHDAEAEAPLARRLPVAKPLEEHVVAPEDRELAEGEEGDDPGRGHVAPHRPAERPGGEVAEEEERDEGAGADQVVDDRRRRARAHASDGVGEHDLLRRLDVDELLEGAPGSGGDRVGGGGRGRRGSHRPQATRGVHQARAKGRCLSGGNAARDLRARRPWRSTVRGR